MALCPHCAADVPGGKPFCAECGSRLAIAPPDSAAETRVGGHSIRHPASSSAPSDDSRFLPGTLLGGRYRVVALLGRGGMGEVYRADDLKLGQAVALKFLPRELERDGARLERLLAEVRLARQVSHPCVCRVYDVGELEGQHFLSMEYVDGEDLATLLRRIGRLPGDKAAQVARQICAGLAAAHDQGILHRDLKPANVMIDGRGRAKVTDFGLASLEEAVAGVEIRSGTPAYMAPEQLAGREVTVRSDLHALGLLLYEMFTGRAAFRGGSALEVSRSRETPLATPSSLVEDLDPAVERIILRCLEENPRDRPASALAVAAALPGGDPLAAALAAGETPSPELVAEAGARGGLSARTASLCLAAAVALLAFAVLFAGNTLVSGRVPLDRPREVLTERAREIARLAGGDEAPADSLFAFEANAGYLEELRTSGPVGDPWSALARGQPAGLHFVYRQSAAPLVRNHAGSIGNWFDDPPPTGPGMVEVRLDTVGRLLGLRANPSRIQGPAPPAASPDWAPLLVAAGFAPDELEPADPLWLPPVFADTRAAWTGVYPEAPRVPVRLEAASYGGRPVFLRLVEPWTRPDEARSRPEGFWRRASDVLRVSWLLVVLAGAGFLAWRNVRLGRGDGKTALRFALWMGAIRLIWILGAKHGALEAEMDTLVAHLAWAAYRVCIVAVFYLALEPYARRLWPRMLSSWVRLFDGRLRDPLVGRDLLLGTIYGGAAALILILVVRAPAALGIAGYGLERNLWSLEALRGLPSALTAVAAVHTESTLNVLVGIMLFLVLRVLLRRTWAAVTIVSLLAVVLFNPGAGHPAPYLVGISLMMGLFWIMFFRVGLLAVVVGSIVGDLLHLLPLTPRLTAWYAEPTYLVIGLVGAVSLWGFRVALAGRPLLVPDGPGSVPSDRS